MSKLYIQSRSEFDKLPDDIKIPTDKTGRPDWVWLRSEFVCDKVDAHRWADAAMRIGNTMYYGNIIVHKGCGVRPVIKFQDDVGPDIKIGSIIKFGVDFEGDPIEWICINDREYITKYTLFYSDFDEKTNKYSESKLRRKLEDAEKVIFGKNELTLLIDTEY